MKKNRFMNIYNSITLLYTGKLIPYCKSSIIQYKIKIKLKKELIQLNSKQNKSPFTKGGNLNRHSFKEEIQMINRHMKRCSAF